MIRPVASFRKSVCVFANVAIFRYPNLSDLRKMTALMMGDEGAGLESAGDRSPLMTRDEEIQRAAGALKAMAHPLRLKILCTLSNREVSVQDIVRQVGASQSNISQHLAILRDKGLLSCRRDATRIYYRIGDARTLQLIGLMRELFCSAHPDPGFEDIEKKRFFYEY
jgi:ArsR family transcriptional regulator